MTKIGEHLIHFDQLPSTNVYAAELLSKSNVKDGTVITTDNQYSGKGQRSNTWESAPNKNIALSVVLFPQNLEAKDQFFFNMAISIAVSETIQTYLSDLVQIKWPNDIYIHKGKVAGILIQNNIQGALIHSAIVGIGININQEVFTSDAPNPVSLYNMSGRYHDLPGIRKTLYSHLSKSYALLKHKDYDTLVERYHKLLYQKGQTCSYLIDNGERVNGTIIGVNSQGLLQVSIRGQTRAFGFKEIKYL